MYIHKLDLKNIGPFKEAHLEFACKFPKEPDAVVSPVTMITGLNGAGKSIVIDAIRVALGSGVVERNIIANDDDFNIGLEIERDGVSASYSTSSFSDGAVKWVDYMNINRIFMYGYEDHTTPANWVLDYWSSSPAVDSFKISSLTQLKHREALKDVLVGYRRNFDVSNFLCNIDYLRTSDVAEEKALGSFVFEKIKQIIDSCLDNGEFKYIRRSDLQPIVEQNGHEITLEKLSSGNIFLIGHMMSLLSKMYSLAVLRGTPVGEMLDTPGVLLADEIENHLHPSWQKKVASIVRQIFPNIQIILTTHSPFVLSSVDGAKIYTCKPYPGGSEVVDETEMYSTMPVDQILSSEARSEERRVGKECP